MGTPHSALHVVYDDLNALFVRKAEKGIRCSPEIAVLKTLGTASTGQARSVDLVRRVDAGRDRLTACLAQRALAAAVPWRRDSRGARASIAAELQRRAMD